MQVKTCLERVVALLTKIVRSRRVGRFPSWAAPAPRARLFLQSDSSTQKWVSQHVIDAGEDAPRAGCSLVDENCSKPPCRALPFLGSPRAESQAFPAVGLEHTKMGIPACHRCR